MPTFRELTDLSSQTATAKTLVRQAFAERLGDVTLDLQLHRHWNGGWRCRATLAGRAPLEFALLTHDEDVLLALPLPMPAGWRLRGVAASDGSRWTASPDGELSPVPSDPRSARIPPPESSGY